MCDPVTLPGLFTPARTFCDANTTSPLPETEVLSLTVASRTVQKIVSLGLLRNTCSIPFGTVVPIITRPSELMRMRSVRNGSVETLRVAKVRCPSVLLEPSVSTPLIEAHAPAVAPKTTMPPAPPVGVVSCRKSEAPFCAADAEVKVGFDDVWPAPRRCRPAHGDGAFKPTFPLESITNRATAGAIVKSAIANFCPPESAMLAPSFQWRSPTIRNPDPGAVLAPLRVTSAAPALFCTSTGHGTETCVLWVSFHAHGVCADKTTGMTARQQLKSRRIL